MFQGSRSTRVMLRRAVPKLATPSPHQSHTLPAGLCSLVEHGSNLELPPQPRLPNSDRLATELRFRRFCETGGVCILPLRISLIQN